MLDEIRAKKKDDDIDLYLTNNFVGGVVIGQVTKKNTQMQL
jgi:hypothetical protein